MGKQIMLVNVHEDETRIALVDNNVLFGLHVQQTDRERKVGNIYRGRVVKINPAFQAAFIDYGETRNGFLSISDVNFNLHSPRESEKGRPRIQNVLREGQSVMVQILKEGLSNKGSALTTFISLAGRYMVMSPNSDRSGVSRKIEDPDTRRRLKEIMEALAGGEDLGVIIRTAGINQPVSELKKDLETLRKEWRNIEGKHEKVKKPGLLYQEPSPIVRVLRDYFSDDVQEVWVDDPEGFQEALRYFKSTLPKFQKRLKLYVGEKSLFSAYRIEEQIEALDSAKVSLKSGGSIVLESTEALVSVDVNSGRSNQAQDIEETALRTNLEAVDEIARQLRLRNLGGLIVIDCIDMMQAKNRKQVEKRLADMLKDDKARTTIGTISQFGILELSRQRIDMERSRGLRVQCPTCGGTGHIPTINSSANNVLRKLRELAATGQYVEIHGELPLETANYLLNSKREAIRDLELEFELSVKLEADPDLPAGHTISLHGARATDAEGEGEPRESRVPREQRAEPGEAPASAVADSAEGDASRRRRRRRRRHRGEGEGDAVRGQDEHRLPQEDMPGLAAANRFDEELEVQDLEAEPEPGENGMAELVEGDHTFDAPHAELHVEPGVIERRPQREPLVPLPARGNGKPDKGLVFMSEHIVTNPEALTKLPPRIVRSNPFRAVAEVVPPGTVVYDSAGVLGATQIGIAPAPDEANGHGEDAAAKRKPRRGRRGSANPAPEAGAAAAMDDSLAEVEEAEVEEAEVEEAFGQPEPARAADVDQPSAPADPAKPGGRRRGRGRGRGKGGAPGGRSAATPAAGAAPGGRSAATPAAGAAPVRAPAATRAAPHHEEDPFHEPGDVNGNVIRPDPPAGAKRPRADPAAGAKRPPARRNRGRRPPGARRPASPAV